MSEKEFPVARLSDLEDGTMKQVSAGGTEVLLARLGDECYAVSAHCPHYGAPLVDGVLNGERIVCPWHHACFDVRTGDLEEPPAFDSLARFDVIIEGEQIMVRLPEQSSDRRVPDMAKRDAQDHRTFVVLGGGAAGFTAAQTLREEGFAGRVILITREDRGPYDRPNLSKDYLQGLAELEWMPLRTADFFAEHDIELLLNKDVVTVDAKERSIVFDDATTIQYHSLLIATGGAPRRLPFQTGSEESNVFLLRSFSDANAIIEAAGSGRRAIIIGAGFIGMEAASSLRSRGCEVTVVAPDNTPFEKTLGPEIGKLLQRVHERNGVKFRLNARVKDFERQESDVNSVLLQSGERLDADLVIVGVGVRPATDFVNGIELHRDGGLITDKYLCVTDSVYAAGDVAHFPDTRRGQLTRIEHWRVAMQQGRVAARNMAGRPEAFTSVPFFWTRQFDETLLYVGHAKDWDKIRFQGDVEKHDFLAFYVKDNRVLAVAGMNRDREMAMWEERIRNNEIPSPDQLSDGRGKDLTSSTDSSSFSALSVL